MNKKVLIATICLFLYANGMAEGLIHSSIKLVQSKEISQLKENEEDFQRVSLLRAVLDHCASSDIKDDIKNQKQSWNSFIIEYSQYIIAKHNIAQDDVVKTIVQSEVDVENKFGTIAPSNICREALAKTTVLSQDWQEIKKRNLISSPQPKDNSPKLINLIGHKYEFI